MTIVSNNPALLALSKKHVPNQQLWFKMIFKFQVLLVSGSRGWIIPGGKVEPREVDDPSFAAVREAREEGGVRGEPLSSLHKVEKMDLAKKLPFKDFVYRRIRYIKFLKKIMGVVERFSDVRNVHPELQLLYAN